MDARPHLQLALIFVLALALPALAEAAQGPAELRARLAGVQLLSSLDDAALKPWRLKASFELFDNNGQPTNQGTLEEWWESPSHWRVQVTSPTLTSLLTNADGKRFQTADTSPLPVSLALLLRQLTNPSFPQSRIDASVPTFESKHFGAATLDCVMMAPASAKQPPFGLYPTSCFDPGTSMLRLVSNYGTQTIIRNRLGRFQDRAVAMDVAVREKSIITGKAQVIELTSYSPQPEEFTPTAAQSLRPARPIRVSAGIGAGLLLSKVTPDYPVEARQKHISGSVVLRASIGSDGHIEDLDPVSSPNDLLTTAAVMAVHQWVYKPYLLNGQVTAIDTTITVNFNMGS